MMIVRVKKTNQVRSREVDQERSEEALLATAKGPTYRSLAKELPRHELQLTRRFVHNLGDYPCLATRRLPIIGEPFSPP